MCLLYVYGVSSIHFPCAYHSIKIMEVGSCCSVHYSLPRDELAKQYANLNNFLETFGHDLIEGHQTILNNIKIRVVEMLNMESKFNCNGYQWQDCVFFEDDCTVGPYICRCENMCRRMGRLQYLMDQYKKIFFFAF